MINCFLDAKPRGVLSSVQVTQDKATLPTHCPPENLLWVGQGLMGPYRTEPILLAIGSRREEGPQHLVI